MTDDGEALTLHLPGEDIAFYGETVEKRHTVLASAMQRKPIVTS